MERSSGPFQLGERLAGRPTAFKITATSLLLSRSGSGAVTVGTAEGQVILPQSAGRPEDTVITALKAKKPVTRLVQLPNDPSTILALCGGELFSLDAQTLNRRPAFQNLRGVMDVAVNDVSEALTGIALCVVTLSPTSAEDGILHLFSGRLEKLREIPLRGAVGTPTQACWCSLNMICVGGTTSATLVDVKGALKKIPIVVDARRGPIILRLPNDRVLLSSAGGLGVVIDMQGFPCPNVGAIVWSSSPVALVCCGPYVVALSDDGCVEIALMDTPGEIIQRMTIPNCSHALVADIGYNTEAQLFSTQGKASPSFSFAVGLAGQHGDTPYRSATALPLEDQVTELLKADSGDCTRALALIKESFPSLSDPAEERRMREAEEFMYLRAAAILLENKSDLDRAFALLSIANIDAIQLFSFGGYVQASPVLGEGSNIIKRIIHELNLFKDEAFRVQVLAHAMRARSAKPSSRNDETGTRSSELLDTAIVLFLSDSNDRNHASRRQLEQFCLDESNRCDVHRCVIELKRRGFDLAAAHLQATHSASSPLDAIDLYRHLNEPSFFCQVLLKSAQSSTMDDASTDLKRVVQDNLEWILTHVTMDDAESVFRALAPKVFPNQDDVPIDRIISVCSGAHVKLLHPRALISAIFQAKQTNGQLVDGDKLASVLVAALEEALDNGQAAKDTSASASLIQLVKHDRSASKAALDALSRSKFKSRLGKERANCLGALNQHREALKILVSELNDLEGAERYCEEHATPSNVQDEPDLAGSAQPDPFAILLALHLERFTEQSTGPRADAAIAFLSRHAERVNPLEAIQALPESLSLAHAMRFLEPALLRVTHSRRSSRVGKNLARTENLQTKLRLTHLERQYFIVTDETLCETCGRRIGDARVPIVHDALREAENTEEDERKPPVKQKSKDSSSALRIRHVSCPLPSPRISSSSSTMKMAPWASSGGSLQAKLYEDEDDDPSQWKQLQ